MSALEAEAAESELRATLIEYNLSEVDDAINAVNAAIASGEACIILPQLYVV